MEKIIIAFSLSEMPYHCELGGQTGHYQFLLVADDTNNSYLAYPVQNLANISPQPFHELAVKELQGVYSQVL